ncbi:MULTISPECIES: hypothetical protein [Rhodococcus]|uniref:hypothetical protein n=1 Tax=Rhodococcus TaxID=1827 RepID=UPI0007AE958D|nr:MULTISPECIES: hypothetical protein [Rhodococcus]KZL33179.1 hypothetical protein A3852_12850 [Rhodococcus qingshengii]MCE4161663.1 hypothetical protein [Rhodococcus sp. Ni2]
MNWAVVIQVGLSAAVALWGIPVAWQHWSLERRLSNQIERNGKVLAQSTGDPDLRYSVELLQREMNELIIRRASLVVYPPARIPSLTVVVLAIVGGSVAWWGTVTTAFIGWFGFIVVAPTLMLSILVALSIRDDAQERKEWIKSGGPLRSSHATRTRTRFLNRHE